MADDTMFDRLPVGAYRTTLAGRQLRANAALVRLNGYASEAELLAAVTSIGSEWYVDPQRREEFARLMARDGQVTDFVSEVHRHRTRERIWVRENAYLVRDEAGQPLYYEGTVEDITEARRSQQALAYSERRFRALTERAQVLTMVVDEATVVHYASPASRLLLGREPQALLNRPTYDWVHPEDVPRAKSEFREVVERRNSGQESIYRVLHADGSVRFIAALGLQCSDDPAVGGIVLNYRDVTEREAALHALRTRDRQFATAFMASPDALIISRLDDGTYLAVNDTFVTLSGYAREELIGRTSVEMNIWVSAGDREAFIEALRRSGRVRDYLTPFQGRTRRGLVSISAEPIEVDGVPCLLAISRDVTRAVEAERELLRLNTELESRVQERTLALQRANAELEAFAYSVAHDLKAPLRALDGYSLLIEEQAGALDEESRGHLRQIRRAARQMTQLIDDLLAYARIERREPALAALRWPALVAHVLDHHGADLQRLGVAPELDVPDEPVLADTQSALLALRNLVDNALKFSAGRQPPVLAIGGRVLASTVMLWVRDNGPGFDMKFHDRIFRIFQRLHRAEDYPGTGVGLALTAKAMERMGGRVWAESRPGAGATFYLELPRASAAAGAGAPESVK